MVGSLFNIFDIMFLPLNLIGIRPQKWFGDLKMMSSASSAMIMCCFCLMFMSNLRR